MLPQKRDLRSRLPLRELTKDIGRQFCEKALALIAASTSGFPMRTWVMRGV